MEKRRKTRKEKITQQRAKQAVKKQEQAIKNKEIDKITITIYILFFLGIMLTFLATIIYEKTFINWWIPFIIWLIAGIITTVIIPKRWKKIFRKDHNIKTLIWETMNNCLTFGGITVFIFLYINLKSPTKNVETQKLKIVKKSSKNGSHGRITPVADVIYKGLTKTVPLKYSEQNKLNDLDYLTLKIKKGNLGFDVIIEKEITESKIKH